MTGNYYGLPTRIIGNQYLRLEFLAEAGPRIVRLMLAGSDENLLAETPDVQWPTPYGDFHLRGGHRLWHAPEAFPRTSYPDDAGLTVEEVEGGVRLSGPVEPHTGVRKSIEIHLCEDGAGATLVHVLSNAGAWPVELAPWAITQLPLGGVAVLPQRIALPDLAGLAPDRHLALWPYASWQDPRLRLYDDYVLVEGAPRMPPVKIGYLNERGWAAYARAGVLFVKRFEPRPGSVYPDRGCNVEVYCSDRCLELETLAPLCTLEPGQTATHVETWRIIAVPAALRLPDDLGDLLAQ
jgi:hypothetical protein